MVKDKAGLMVVVESGEPVVSSEVLAEGFEATHKSVLFLVKKYFSDFSDFGTLEVKKRKSAGVPVSFYMLNEEQAAFLGTLLRNNSKTVGFKKRLTAEFFRIRRQLAQILAQKQNAEWLEKRQAGKITRNEETAVIKEFVDYAISQGSENAQKYYANITKMQNQALFIFDYKFPNLRDALGINQLSICSVADTIVARAIREGMERRLHYKDIYKLMKERVVNFAALHGRSPVPVPISAPKQPLLIEARP